VKPVHLLLGLISGAWLSGCGGWASDSQDDVPAAAQAYDRVLSWSSLESQIPNDLDADDSTALATRLMEAWLREQVMLHQAEQELQAEDLDFSEELEAYRNALVMHRFEERYVAERLNAEVTEAEARAFYEAQSALFPVNDYVVRARFLHLPADGRDLASVQNLFLSMDSSQVAVLEAWCVENGAVYSIDPEIWWLLDDLIQEVPLQLYRPERQIADRRLISFEQDGRLYWLQFLEHSLKDAPAPFELVRERIEELILHARRTELLSTLQERLLEKAHTEGAILRSEAPLP
jgi:hypothetical protein